MYTVALWDRKALSDDPDSTLLFWRIVCQAGNSGTHITSAIYGFG